MDKRILSMFLIAVACMALLPVAALASVNVGASYADGVVTVTGAGFTAGAGYTVRVVNTANLDIRAMGQATADGSGSISASIVTGPMETLSGHAVYVNRPDGTLAGSVTSIAGAAGPPPPSPRRTARSQRAAAAPQAGVSVSAGGDAAVVSAGVKAAGDPATGKYKAAVRAETVAALAGKAKEIEDAGQRAVIEIKVEAAEGAKAVEAEIPRDAFKQLADTTNAAVTVSSGVGTVTFDAGAVDSISAQAAEGDISIAVQKVETDGLPEEIRAEVGDRPVYDFSVRAGGDEISDFGGGKVEIRVPYSLKAGEDADSIVVYHIDAAGRLTAVRGRYDAATGTVILTVTHFSEYMIGYNRVRFADVGETDWYNKAIGFIAARGIARGVGGDRFAPGESVTRADFLIMAMNAYGIEPDTNISDNFADAGNGYYAGYLGTAKRLGLASGMGDNEYAPEETISREDMLVILYRMLEKLGELPSGTAGRSFESFGDASDVSGYAEDAVKRFVETGTVAGDGESLAPKNVSTRAQAAQILYNLLSK